MKVRLVVAPGPHLLQHEDAQYLVPTHPRLSRRRILQTANQILRNRFRHGRIGIQDPTDRFQLLRVGMIDPGLIQAELFVTAHSVVALSLVRRQLVRDKPNLSFRCKDRQH